MKVIKYLFRLLQVLLYFPIHMIIAGIAGCILFGFVIFAALCSYLEVLVFVGANDESRSSWFIL